MSDKDMNGAFDSQTKEQSKVYQQRVNYYLQQLKNQPVFTEQNIHKWHDGILHISQSINELAIGKQITGELEQLTRTNEQLRIQFDNILQNQYPHLKNAIRQKLEKSQDPKNQNVPATSCRFFNYGSQVFNNNRRQVEFKNYTLDSFEDSDVRDSIKKIIVSFLNSIGGTIFIGIRDYDMTVQGVDLSRIDMDSLKLIILDIRRYIEPDCNLLINVDFIPVMQWGKFSNGKWVVRVKVAQGDLLNIYVYQIKPEDSTVFSSAFREEDGSTQCYELKEFLLQNKQIYQMGRQPTAAIEYAPPHDQAYFCESDEVSYPPQAMVEKPIIQQEQFDYQMKEQQAKMKSLEEENKRLDSELIIARKQLVEKDQFQIKDKNVKELLLEIKELTAKLRTKKEKSKQKKNQIKVLEEKCKDLPSSKQFELPQKNQQQQQLFAENQQGNGSKASFSQPPWNSKQVESQNQQDYDQSGFEKRNQKKDIFSSEMVNQAQERGNFRERSFKVNKFLKNQNLPQQNKVKSEDPWKSKQQQEQQYQSTEFRTQIKQDKQLNQQKNPQFKQEFTYERKDKDPNSNKMENSNKNSYGKNNLNSYDPQFEEEEEEKQFSQVQDITKPTYYFGGTPQYDMPAEGEDQFSMPNKEEGISRDLLHNYGLWILFAMRNKQDCERILKIFQEELLEEDCQIKHDEGRNIVGGFFLNTLLARKFFARISKKQLQFLKVMTKLTKSQEIRESYFLYGPGQKRNDEEKSSCPVILLDNINGKEEVQDKIKKILECEEIKQIKQNKYFVRTEEDKITNLTADLIVGMKRDNSVERIGAIVGEQVTIVGNNLNEKEIEKYLISCIIFLRLSVEKHFDKIVVTFSNTIDALIGQLKLEESEIKGIRSVSIDQIVDVPFGF